MNDFNILARNIKAYRQIAGFSQKELGEKVGLSGVAIMRYEKGIREPKTETVKKLADALGVPYLRLYGWNGDETDIDEVIGIVSEKMRDLAEESQKSVEAALRDTINRAFESMNEKGQQRAVEQVEDLAKVPEYQKGAELPLQAHEGENKQQQAEE